MYGSMMPAPPSSKELPTSWIYVLRAVELDDADVEPTDIVRVHRSRPVDIARRRRLPHELHW